MLAATLSQSSFTTAGNSNAIILTRNSLITKQTISIGRVLIISMFGVHSLQVSYNATVKRGLAL